MYISENQVEGSLEDTSVAELLDACHKALLTGTIKISAGSVEAVLELRAGAVDAVEYNGMNKLEAVAELSDLKMGTFELTQRIPSLSGELADSARLEGSDAEVSVIELMQHCEENALSCTIVAVAGFDRAEIHYKVGEIEDVVFNGKSDPDRIVEIVRFKDARFRLTPPPLDLGILTWPVVRKDPTPPFVPQRDEGADGKAADKPEAEPTKTGEKKAAKKAGDKKADMDDMAEAKKAGKDDQDEAKKAGDKKAEAKKAGKNDEAKKAGDKKAGDKKADKDDMAEAKKVDDDQVEDEADEYDDDEYDYDYEDVDEDEREAHADDERLAARARERDEPPPPPKSSALWFVLIAAVIAVAGFVGYQLYQSMTP